jgi:hypothetical protein
VTLLNLFLPKKRYSVTFWPPNRQKKGKTNFDFHLASLRISFSVRRSYLPDVGPICAESPCIEDYFGVWYISELQILAEILRFKVAASFGKFIIFRFWLSLTRISISVWRSYLPDVGPICAESPCIEDYFSVWYISELQILAEILRFKAASSFFQNLAIFKIWETFLKLNFLILDFQSNIF